MASVLIVFPRSKERGLIEAFYNWVDICRVATFRVRKSAASLKRIAFAISEACVVVFPRSKERGLIEAARMTTYLLAPCTFRVRKSAASLKPCPRFEVSALPASFRVRKSAASLKLNSIQSFLAHHILSAFERARPH